MITKQLPHSYNLRSYHNLYNLCSNSYQSLLIKKLPFHSKHEFQCQSNTWTKLPDNPESVSFSLELDSWVSITVFLQQKVKQK